MLSLFRNRRSRVSKAHVGEEDIDWMDCAWRLLENEV